MKRRSLLVQEIRRKRKREGKEKDINDGLRKKKLIKQEMRIKVWREIMTSKNKERIKSCVLGDNSKVLRNQNGENLSSFMGQIITERLHSYFSSLIFGLK